MNKLIFIPMLTACLSGIACANPTSNALDGATYTAEVYGKPWPDPKYERAQSGTFVQYKDKAKNYSWHVPDVWPTATHAPLLVSDVSAKYLFVIGETRGNNCCSVILGFNLNNDSYIGEVIKSLGPVTVLPKKSNCSLLVEAQVVDEKVFSDKKLKNEAEIENATPVRDLCFRDGKFQPIAGS